METLKLIKAEDPEKITAIAALANDIWHEHFTDIIGEDQVNYMVDKFQSYPAISDQISNGYEYYQIYSGQVFSGYTGIKEENGCLFLSKLYIKKDCRGQHISTRVLQYLTSLCRERGLSKLWLTCNKYNAHTLAVYKHFGFSVVREQKADIGNGYYMDDYILELGTEVF